MTDTAYMYASRSVAEFHEMARWVELSRRARAEWESGKSVEEIAAEFNASGTPAPAWPRRRGRLRVAPKRTADGQTVYALCAVR